MGLISGAKLEGVELHELKKNVDSRGSFTEKIQKHWDSCIDPVQWSTVESGPGVFRGMHYHSRHDEYFSLITGRCLVGLKDLRPGSPTDNGYSLFELTADSPSAITFPRGILHGWYFFEASLHIQSVSESYNDYCYHKPPVNFVGFPAIVDVQQTLQVKHRGLHVKSPHKKRFYG